MPWVVSGKTKAGGVNRGSVAVRLEDTSGNVLDQDTSDGDGDYSVGTSFVGSVRLYAAKGTSHEVSAVKESDGVGTATQDLNSPNAVPSVADLSDESFVEDTGTKTLDFAITDTDSVDVLTAELSSGPSWVSVSTPDTSPPGVGRLHINTDLASPGNYNVSYRAKDDWNGVSTNKSLTITILAVVALVDPGDKSYPNNSGNQSFDLSATGGQTPYTFSKLSGPSWVSVSSGGTVTVNTNTATRGNHSVTFKVVDDLGSEDTETITISITNNAPVLTNPGNKTYQNNDGLKQFQLEATDADGDPMTFSKVSGPAGVTISSSGQVTVDTVALTRAVHSVTAQVIDGQGGSHQQSFDITILNNAPVLVNPGAVELQVSTGLRTQQLSASDIDLDALGFSKLAGQAFITISASGLLSVQTNGPRDDDTEDFEGVGTPTHPDATWSSVTTGTGVAVDWDYDRTLITGAPAEWGAESAKTQTGVTGGESFARLALGAAFDTVKVTAEVIVEATTNDGGDGHVNFLRFTDNTNVLVRIHTGSGSTLLRVHHKKANNTFTLAYSQPMSLDTKEKISVEWVKGTSLKVWRNDILVVNTSDVFNGANSIVDFGCIGGPNDNSIIHVDNVVFTSPSPLKDTYPVTVEVDDGNGGTDQESFDVVLQDPIDMSFFQVVA